MNLVDVRRVLVTRLRWLGDVVMSTPMLEALREALPAASIEYLTYSSFAPALETHPACDRVHTLPPKAGPAATLNVAQRLRQPPIDWCFDTLGNPRSAILVKLLAPRHSVGPARGLRSFLYEHRQRRDAAERSAVRHQLDMLTPLLGRVAERPTSLHVEEGERRQMADRLGLGAEADLVLIHPGATHPERAWPLARWVELIERLQGSAGARVRIITQPGWEGAARRIATEGAGDVERLPALGLRELMATLSLASLYVGNDGGIMHCAVALRVPTVAVLGPTEPEAWFPYARWGPYRALCRFRQERCEIAGRVAGGFPDVSVAEVMGAIDEIRVD